MGKVLSIVKRKNITIPNTVIRLSETVRLKFPLILYQVLVTKINKLVIGIIIELKIFLIGDEDLNYQTINTCQISLGIFDDDVMIGEVCIR